MKETGAAFWQKIARHYTSMMKHSAPLYREICNRIRRRLTRDMNVLELACGTGQLSVLLSPHPGYIFPCKMLSPCPMLRKPSTQS